MLQYADDIAIFAHGTNLTKAVESVQKTIDSLQVYLRAKGLEISPDKSQCVIFSRKNKIPNFQRINVGNQIIPLSDSFKFLGVWLDAKMTGKKHLTYLIQKGKSIVNILSSLSGVWWGSHPQSLLTIYRAVFKGSIEYGCQVFQFQRNQTLFRCLQRLQWRAIRIAMGYRISTPINIILAEAKEAPLRNRFKLLLSRFLLKSFLKSGNPMINSLRYLEDISCNRRKRINAIRCIPIFKLYIAFKYYKGRIKRSVFLLAFLYPYNVTIFTQEYREVVTHVNDSTPKEFIVSKFQEFLYTFPQDTTVLYTDGSKLGTDGPTGVGIYSPTLQLNFSHCLPPGTSIFTAEAWALLVAVKSICEEQCVRAVIFTDSKSVLEAIASPRTNNDNYLMYSLKNQLYLADSSGIQVDLVWIPSHRGIRGNEEVDDLAKLGARNGTRMDIKIPYTDTLAEPKVK
ncbi:uncharacterized protein [Mycetomoellerius zeteki]|uniref:uncharacterized protein n=1 Tax=Mycetomoellerius zeteki TaxID=64791 RepID=UPI00084E66D2|nr:PREDICTED: uncharacterized protein LOC108729018 [Trachymyrmex zeteki]